MVKPREYQIAAAGVVSRYWASFEIAYLYFQRVHDDEAVTFSSQARESRSEVGGSSTTTSRQLEKNYTQYLFGASRARVRRGVGGLCIVASQIMDGLVAGDV